MISENDIIKLARLSKLTVGKEEVARLTTDLNSILGYVEKLQKVDVSKIEPMSHVHGVTNVFREDEVELSLSIDDTLAAAPDKSGRFIRVPIVIDQGDN